MSLKGKIVIASDDKKNLAALEHLLAPLKYDLCSARDIEKLSSLARKEMPDLIVADPDSLKGDPLALLKELKETVLPKMVAIIITSSSIDQAFLKGLRESKIDDYIKKPVSYSLLLEKIKRLLLVETSPERLDFSDGQEFTFHGDLSEIPLPRILYFLKRDARTGILSITKDNIKKVISIEAGDPKFVVSNIVQECLGRLLVTKGRLSEAECEESLKLMREWKKKQGETLIKMGLIEPYELDETLKMQARERLLEALGWQAGEYKFLGKKYLREDLTPLDIAIPQIVLLGVRRYYTLDTLQRHLAKWHEHIPTFSEKSIFKIEDFKLATWDAKTIRFFDGKKNFKEILNARIVREIDVYHLMFTFYALGLVFFKESDAAKTRQEDTISAGFEKMKSLNPFQILDVDYDADDEQIKVAMDSLLLKYSTSRLKASNETRERIDEAVALVNEAYEKIKDRNSRLMFIKRLFLEEGVVNKQTAEVVLPEEVVAKGKDYIAKRNYHKAQLMFLNGIKIFPDAGRIYSYLGYALFMMVEQEKDMAPKLLADAQKAMKKGLVLSPHEEEPHLFYGKLMKYIGEEEAAKKEFKKVVTLNPENIEAVQELRVIGIREKKKNTSFIKWKK